MAPTTAAKSFVFRFADVTVREREFAIAKAGMTQQVEPKVFQVLLILVRNPNQLIAKEELLSSVWGETAVTENSLARNIALLRRLLGDDPRSPRFIETVSGIGYRFICPVEVAEDTPALPAHTYLTSRVNGYVHETRPANPSGGGKKAARRRWLLAGAAGTAAVLAGAVVWYAHLPLPPPHVTEVMQLTRDVRFVRKQVMGTDGTRIYLSLEPPALGSVPVSGGDITTIPFAVPGAAFVYAACLGDVSPDGLSFIACGAVKDGMWEDWVVGTLGSPVRYLTESHGVAWSPDGKQVVYSNVQGDIFAMPAIGGPSRMLLHWKGDYGNIPRCLTWSPEGGRIRFARNSRIWEISATGGNLHEIVPEMKESVYKSCGRWTPDGAFYIFQSAKSLREGYQLWALDERHTSLRRPNPEPIQLTFGENRWSRPAISRDGRTLYAPSETQQGELIRFDTKTREFQRYLGGISAEWLDFSPDGRYVAYVSFPDSTLWRANRDGSGRIQLATLPPDKFVRGLHWSPDGSRIVFAESTGTVDALYQVSMEGGAPARLLPEVNESQSGPTWSPDGKRFAYWVNNTDQTSTTEIRIVDLATHKIAHLPPAPKGAWRPVWSPDGRYIVCETDWLNAAQFGFALFDMKTQEWTILPQPSASSYANWSHDSRFVYFLRTQEAQPGVYRMSIPDGRTELAVDLKDFRTTGHGGTDWLGLDPGDAPLLLRNAGTMEIYALTLDRK